MAFETVENQSGGQNPAAVQHLYQSAMEGIQSFVQSDTFKNLSDKISAAMPELSLFNGDSASGADNDKAPNDGLPGLDIVDGAGVPLAQDKHDFATGQSESSGTQGLPKDDPFGQDDRQSTAQSNTSGEEPSIKASEAKSASAGQTERK